MASGLEKAREYAEKVQREYEAALGKHRNVGRCRTGSDACDLATHSHHNLSILSRVYVGSVGFDTKEEDLKKVLSVFGPVKSISLSPDMSTGHHRGFGFVEYEFPDAAALAQAGPHGCDVNGRELKVGRPSNYPATLPPGIDPPTNRRIYISNIHPQIQGAEVVELCGAIGIIESSVFPSKPGTDAHLGYGFVEYRHESSAAKAAAKLSGICLGGKTLRVSVSVIGGAMPHSIVGFLA